MIPSDKLASVQPPKPDEGLLECDMPGVFRSADAASIVARRTHVRLRAWHLFLMILGSFLFFLRNLPFLSQHADHVSVVWTITLIFVICLPAFAMIRQTGKRWFSCRSVAESVKSAVWRYTVKAAPFGGDDDAASQRFTSTVQDVKMATKFETKYLAGHNDPEGELITTRMTTLRSESYESRRSLYLWFRVRDQKCWYAKKAQRLSRWESWYQWFAILAPILAIVAIVLPYNFNGVSFGAAVPFVMTVVAAATAWAQTMRYGELASSYSYVFDQLTYLETLVSSCQESDFDDAVDQVESTISKEHSIWRVREAD